LLFIPEIYVSSNKVSIVLTAYCDYLSVALREFEIYTTYQKMLGELDDSACVSHQLVGNEF